MSVGPDGDSTLLDRHAAGVAAPVAPARNERAPPQPPSEGQGLRIRTWLAALTVGWALLACIPTSYVIWRAYQDQRAMTELHTLETARALTIAVDGEFERFIATLQALATSQLLDRPDFVAFQREASDVLGAYPGAVIVLADATGQELVSTPRNLGETLSKRANIALLRRIFADGKPAISDSFADATAADPPVAAAVPVLRKGDVVYGLTMGIPPAYFADILRRQHLPADWIASIFDGNGAVVARTHASERYLGHRGAPTLMERMAKVREGVVETTTLEGVVVFSAFSRSFISGWAVAIGVPKEELNAQLARILWGTAGGGAVLLLPGLLLAKFIGQRIVRPIQALSAPALAVGRGDPVEVPPLRLYEANQVGRSLIAASRLLRRRAEQRFHAEQERAEAEAWLRLAMDVGRMGTWEFDPASRRVVGSQSTDTIHGMPSEDQPRTLGDYMRRVHPDDVERFSREMIEATRRRGVVAIEYRLLQAGGSVRWIASRGAFVRRPDGSGRLIGALFDITDRKQSEAALAKALHEKDGLIAQKEMLFREINHRVKNSLQSVSALLRLQAASRRHSELREQLLEADQRVLIIARVHEQFYTQAESATKIDIGQYLRNVCGGFERSGGEGGPKVSVEVAADPSEMAADQALSLALLVNELVTNALKHAFQGKEAGTVAVTFRVERDGRRWLSVADDGCGLPDGFSPQDSTGLGMKLVRGFAEALEGQLVIDSSAAGSRFTVIMPPARSL
jgi:PAS domain S-box-containing protein